MIHNNRITKSPASYVFLPHFVFFSHLPPTFWKKKKKSADLSRIYTKVTLIEMEMDYYQVFFNFSHPAANIFHSLDFIFDLTAFFIEASIFFFLYLKGSFILFATNFLICWNIAWCFWRIGPTRNPLK